MGETVPPSIAMLVLGSITSLSIGALFVAGIVPAAVVAVVLGVAVYLRAGRGSADALPQVAQALRGALAGAAHATDHFRWDSARCCHAYRGVRLRGRLRAADLS